MTFAAELVKATRAFCSDHVDDAVEEFVRLAQRTIDGSSFASCTTRHLPAAPATIGASHPEALVLDQLQYGIGAGPCLDAIDTNEVVQVSNFAEDRRWALGPGATRLTSSALCVPFADQRRPDRAVGSLNLYSAEQDAYSSAAAIETATLLGTHLSALLTMATVIQQLVTGLESRDAIGQAKGILMAREGVTALEAFHALRRSSQQQNRKLREVAAELALSTKRPLDSPQ